MTYLDSELEKRQLPSLFCHEDGSAVTAESWGVRRGELLEKLCVNSYGRTPGAPDSVWGTVEKTALTCAGKVVQKTVRISFETPKGEFSFPVELFVPRNAKNPPAIVNIDFWSAVPNKYCPLEEITDRGFALAHFCCNDVIPDRMDGNFDIGLGAMYRQAGTPRTPEEWGKIGMWAFGCSRVLDWLIASGEVAADRIAVAGHSRLGKTALWAAAQDQRFFMAISNDSGVGGAAIHKNGSGERVRAFLKAGSWCWFCENFKRFDGIEDTNSVYDQHMLLALIAPRYICVGSAEIDPGADPRSEFLNCYAQNRVYRLFGETGLVTPDCYPPEGSRLTEGKISYHIRPGTHFFSREDWNYYMDCIRLKTELEIGGTMV